MVATRCCAEWTFLKKIGLNCEIVVTRGVSRMLMMPKMLEQSLGFRMDGPSTLDLGLIAFFGAPSASRAFFAAASAFAPARRLQMLFLVIKFVV